MHVDYLIIGLGNPGKEYAGTRHNVGADFLRTFANEQGIEFKYEKMAGGELAFLQEGEKILALFIPETYMNNSGVSAKKLLKFFEFKNMDNLLVLYDELNIELGNIKISKGKSAGGHNGLDSVISHIGTKDFYRLRIGIGRGKKISNMKSYVLKKFSLFDRPKLTKAFDKTKRAILIFVSQGAEKAMNSLNNK